METEARGLSKKKRREQALPVMIRMCNEHGDGNAIFTGWWMTPRQVKRFNAEQEHIQGQQHT